MNRYRIVYWLGGMRTEWYVKASSKEDAIKKFERIKGKDKSIVNVEDATREY